MNVAGPPNNEAFKATVETASNAQRAGQRRECVHDAVGEHRNRVSAERRLNAPAVEGERLAASGGGLRWGPPDRHTSLTLAAHDTAQ